jgi:hypothetical protein
MRGEPAQIICIEHPYGNKSQGGTYPHSVPMILVRCLGIAAVVLGVACSATGQSSPIYQAEGNDDPRGNVNLAIPMAIPLNPTAKAVHLGFGFTVGGGYNITRSHGIVSEFTWNHLLPTNEALAKLRLALNNPNIDANANVLSFTGNYRYELRGHALGAYLIGGGGLYFRHTELSQKVTTGSDIVCTPMWLWWGFECESGTVTENQTVGSWSASSLGGNGGVGFTARVGEAPYRMYIESRYHYAPDKRVNTQLIDISFGIRY